MGMRSNWFSASKSRFNEMLEERLSASGIYGHRMIDHTLNSSQRNPDPFVGVLLAHAWTDHSPTSKDKLLSDFLIAGGCTFRRNSNDLVDAYVGFRVRPSYSSIVDGRRDAKVIWGELKTRFDWIATEFDGHHEQWAGFKYVTPASETEDYLGSLSESIVGIAKRILE